jgi:CheY-like chemotaxis protein
MDAPTASRPAAARPTEARGGPETVLIAEDQVALRNLVAQALRDLGYDVIATADGEAAVEEFRARRDVRLVILDVVMPRLGGREAYARIKAIDPTMCALFVTGYAPESSLVADLVGQPGVAVLDKPFRLDDLARLVRRLLDSEGDGR